MSTPCVRAASPEDVAVMAELNAEVQELHFASRPDSFKPVLVGEIAEWLRGLLRNPAARLWVAEFGAAVVGYVVAMERQRPENVFCPARKWWEIDQIGVRAGCRRSGVGRALIQQVVSAARALGIRDIELHTWAFNQDAQRAFQRLGFVPRALRFELTESA